MQIKRKGNSFPPFHIIMRSLLVLDFMLARAANVWVDDDLSLLQTRAVLQNGDLVSQPGSWVVTSPEGPFGSATCNRNLLFSDSLDNFISDAGKTPRMAVGANSAEDCNARCTEHPECMFWQWDPQATPVPNFAPIPSSRCQFRTKHFSLGPDLVGTYTAEQSLARNFVDPDAGNIWVQNPCQLKTGWECTTRPNTACGLRACRFPPTERFCEEVDMEYSGRQINYRASDNTFAANTADCRAMCTANDNCFFWQFGGTQGDNYCQIMSGEGSGLRPSPGKVAGARFCTEKPTTTTEIPAIPVADEVFALRSPQRPQPQRPQQ